MDDWDSIEQDLKQLEHEFSSNDSFLEQLSGPTAADYWKKKLDAEKQLFSKTVETKEQEKKVLESKLEQTLVEMNNLHEQVNKLEQSLSDESQTWQERLKTKETELVLQKERVDWVEKIKELEYQNKLVREELDRTRKFYAQQIEDNRITHVKEMEELMAAQNILIGNFDMIEQEFAQVQSLYESDRAQTSKEKQNLLNDIDARIQELNTAKEKVTRFEKENAELITRIDTLSSEAIREREEYRQYVQSMMNEFIYTIKDNLGSVLGINNFCLRRMKVSKIVKKQLLIINKITGKMLEAIGLLKI
jgi:chromosome segregation ATPase